MEDISIIALFCSDARREVGGTETLVGVLPDTIKLPRLPGAFAQICIYVRMHLQPNFRAKEIITRVEMPDGSVFDKSAMSADLLESTIAKLQSGVPYSGMIVKFVVAPFQIAQEGRVQVIVAIDGRDHLVGALNCKLASNAEQVT